MKTVIFSDTHFSTTVDEPRLKYLRRLIASADQVIINGDFFDGYLISFDDFIKSGWSKLFPLLKDKTLYIYGNHDKATHSDKRVSLFSKKQVLEYDMQSGNVHIHIVHGDQMTPSLDGMWPGLITHFGQWYKYWLLVEYDLARAIPPIRWVLDAKRQTKNYQMALKVRKWPKDTVMVAGHTHIAFQTRHFYNPGRFSTRTARYLHIEDGTITLVQEKLK